LRSCNLKEITMPDDAKKKFEEGKKAALEKLQKAKQTADKLAGAAKAAAGDFEKAEKESESK
jgi:hypothetical protein